MDLIRANVGASGAANNAERPDLAANMNNSNPTGVVHSGGNVIGFNTAAFTLQPNGIFGNLGRNTLAATGFADVDVSPEKNTKLSECTSLQIRADAFNALNHTNFSYPNAQLYLGADASGNAILNPSAALITAANGQNRIMQLSAKFQF